MVRKSCINKIKIFKKKDISHQNLGSSNNAYDSHI